MSARKPREIAQEIVWQWMTTSLDDFTRSCIDDRGITLIEAIAAAIICEHCGLPLTCNAELREDLEGHKAMLDENITERDKAKAHAEGLAEVLEKITREYHELRCWLEVPRYQPPLEVCLRDQCVANRTALTAWRAARGGGG